MEKNIKFEYQGTTYVLEFTKRTRKQMEERGFNATELISAPMVVLPELFRGAFLANHKYAKKDLVDEMFEKFTNKEALLDKLVALYAEPLKEMMADPEEGNGIEWDASF